MTYYVNSSDFPHSAVVYVEATFSNGMVYSGSGVVVGQNDVLTAAHVIYSATDGGLATSVTVYPAMDGYDYQPFGSYEVDLINYFEIDDDGDGLLYPEDSERDVALLGFSELIGDDTGMFQIDPNGTDGTYYVTGYPGVYEDESGPRLTEDSGYMSLDSYTYTWNHDDIEINSGNSGGPLWHYVNGQPSVVSVVSTDSFSIDLYGQYDTIIGWLNGNDSLIGDDDDTLYGGSGNDSLPGDDNGATSGDDFIPGTGSDDVLYAQYGDDTIYGGTGADVLYGNQGNDMLRGEDGNDTIFGGQQSDDIVGATGHDVLYGNFDADLIEGDEGDDIIFGGQSDDIISGGLGNDWLFGNRGDDSLTGGLGQDTIQFNFAISAGTDIIYDFTAGEDSIVVTNSAGTGAHMNFDAANNQTVISTLISYDQGQYLPGGIFQSAGSAPNAIIIIGGDFIGLEGSSILLL
jgi:Ca2+-binding RTX toxin-like protein